jgi:hypothetical protein
MKPLRTARQYLARAKALGVTALNMVAILAAKSPGLSAARLILLTSRRPS